MTLKGRGKLRECVFRPTEQGKRYDLNRTNYCVPSDSAPKQPCTSGARRVELPSLTAKEAGRPSGRVGSAGLAECGRESEDICCGEDEYYFDDSADCRCG